LTSGLALLVRWSIRQKLNRVSSVQLRRFVRALSLRRLLYMRSFCWERHKWNAPKWNSSCSAVHLISVHVIVSNQQCASE